MVETDPEVAAIWRAMPKFPAFMPLAAEFARDRAAGHPAFDEALMPIVAASPIHKINRRIPAHLRVLDLAEEIVAARLAEAPKAAEPSKGPPRRGDARPPAQRAEGRRADAATGVSRPAHAGAGLR